MTTGGGREGREAKTQRLVLGACTHAPRGTQPSSGHKAGLLSCVSGRTDEAGATRLTLWASGKPPAGSGESPAAPGALPAPSPTAFHGEPPPHSAIPKARGGNRLGTKKSASLHTNSS